MASEEACEESPAAVCNVSLVTAAPSQLLGGVRQEQGLVIHGTDPQNMGLGRLLFFPGCLDAPVPSEHDSWGRLTLRL